MSAVWIPVLASMKGFIAEVNRGAESASRSAGASLEKGLGEAGKRGGESAGQQIARAVEQQTQKITRARSAQAKAAADVETAEHKLNTLRQSGTATASQIARAEQQLETAKGKHQVASDQLARGERDLEAVRNGGQATANTLARAEDQLAAAKVRATTALGQAKTAELQVDEARAKAVAAADKVAAAEQKVSSAREQYGAGAREVTQAEKQLETAKREAANADQKVVEAAGRSKKARADLANATDDVKSKTLNLKSVQEDVARAEKRAGDEADAAGRKIRGMGDAMSGAEPGATTLTDGLMGLAGKATLAAGAFLGVQGAGSIMAAGFAKYTSLEDTAASLEVITGSAEAAEVAIQGLRETNEGTPYSFDAWAEAGRNLIAFGVDVEYASTVVEALGEAASASGKGEAALSSMADAMGKAAASGKVSMETINSLAAGGVEGLKILANHFGVSTEEMQKMISNGAVPAQEAIEALTEGIIHGTDGAAGSTAAFSGVMGELGDTTSGRIARMKSAFTNLGMDIITLVAPAIELFVDAMMSAVGWVRDMLGPLKDFGKWLGDNAVAVGAVTGVLGALTLGMMAYNVQQKLAAAGGLLSFFRQLAGVKRIAAGAQMLLNGAMWASPITWIVAGIALVIGALVLFFTKTETGRELWAKFTDFLGEAWERIKGFFASAWEAIRPVWDGIVDGAQWVWDKLGGFFEWIGVAWEGLTSLFGDGDFTGAMRDAFGVDEDSAIVDWLFRIRDGFIAVKDGVGVAIDWVRDKWAEFTTGFGQFYDTWIAPVVNAFVAAFDALSAAATWWVDNVTRPALGLLGQAFTNLWNNVISPIIGLFQAGAQILGAVLSGVFQGVIVPAWNFVGSMISSVWNNIIRPVWDFIRAAAGLLADILTGNFDNIGSRFSDMGQAISDVVHGVIQAGLDFFRGLVEMVRQAWESFKDTVARVVGIVADKIQEMIGHIREIPGKVRDVFASAGEWLVNAGRRIINGLWEGMKSAWNNVRNWLSENLSFNAVGSLIGLSGGGVVEMRDGGVVHQYIAGGIDRLESYANGGGRENHTAQIAPAGAWRVWAEPETGGEAYIPLAPSKRERSTAILDEVAGRFGYQLVGADGVPYAGGYRGDLGPQHVAHFADGAVVSSEDFETFVHGGSVGGQKASGSLEGWVYQNFPSDSGAWGDCSYTVGKVTALAVGRPTPGRHFSTRDEASVLTSWGFLRGRGGDGDLRIGMRNGGPGGGHTSGTLPSGVNFEMGGGRGNGQIGGGAAGAWDSYYNEFFYLPVGPTFENVDPGGLGDMSPDSPYVGGTGDNVTVTEPSAASSTSTKESDTISGTIGGLAREAIEGQVQDILGVFGVPDTLPSWLTGAREVHSAATSPRTSVAEDNAAANHDAAVTSMTGDELAADPQMSGADGFDTVAQPEVPEWGMGFFVHEIARQAKALGLSKDGAKIGVATALVESGDPMLMYANNRVPESLKYRHDALGSDHDSVGLFQQRDNGAWGTVAQRMDAFESAGLFFAELMKFDWESMEPGAAAQKVQRSAYPDRYATKMDRALGLVEDTGLYDTGGILPHRGLALNLSGKPEAILTRDQWEMLSRLGAQLPQLVGGTVRDGVTGGARAAGGLADTIVPGAGALMGPAGELGGWYAGEVAAGWTQAILDASEQAVGAALEPVQDLAGAVAAPPTVTAAPPVVDGVPARPAGTADVPAGGGQTVIIQVSNVDQALEAQKHVEARALAGFGYGR